MGKLYIAYNSPAYIHTSMAVCYIGVTILINLAVNCICSWGLSVTNLNMAALIIQCIKMYLYKILSVLMRQRPASCTPGIYSDWLAFYNFDNLIVIRFLFQVLG